MLSVFFEDNWSIAGQILCAFSIRRNDDAFLQYQAAWLLLHLYRLFLLFPEVEDILSQSHSRHYGRQALSLCFFNFKNEIFFQQVLPGTNTFHNKSILRCNIFYHIQVTSVKKCHQYLGAGMNIITKSFK